MFLSWTTSDNGIKERALVNSSKQSKERMWRWGCGCDDTKSGGETVLRAWPIPVPNTAIAQPLDCATGHLPSQATLQPTTPFPCHSTSASCHTAIWNNAQHQSSHRRTQASLFHPTGNLLFEYSSNRFIPHQILVLTFFLLFILNPCMCGKIH